MSERTVAVWSDAVASQVFRSLQAEIAAVNTACGWYDDIEDRTIGDDCALIHSEVSEMLEAYRDHGLADATASEAPHHERCSVSRLTYPTRIDSKPVYEGGACTCEVHGQTRLPKPEGFGSEAADVLIRLLDTCDRRGVDLMAETRRKITFNKTRAYRHGGKRM